MAQAKRKTIEAVVSQGRALRFLPLVKEKRYSGVDSKHVGNMEPEWPSLDIQRAWTAQERTGQLIRAFNWYSYTHESKDARGFVVEFFSHMPRYDALMRDLKKLPDYAPNQTIGWLCRMGRRGLELNFRELRRILTQVQEAVERNKTSAKETVETAPKNVINIQDRLNEKMSECLGEIEGAYDEFWAAGWTGNFGIMNVIKVQNPPPNRIKEMIEFCERVHLNELTDAAEGRDAQLVEGYSHMTKRQLNSAIKWWTQAIADLNSYGNIKKTERKPRAKKPVSPEKQVRRIKYCRKSDELGLTSISPTDILRSSEVWVYNVKKRKLGVYQADPMVQTLGVKGSSIVGFDPATSMQKTLRKPPEQLKALMAAGKPASKKLFKEIKATDVKLNGRLGDDWVILKAYK